MAVTWTNLGNGADLENQTNFRLTFVDSGGGTGSAVPIQYVPAGERLTVCKAVADAIQARTAYKLNAITTYVAINEADPVPEDPGADVPGDTWLGFVKDPSTPGLRHKVSFHVPGALFPDGDSGEEFGQAIAAALSSGGVDYEFRKWAGATS